MSLRKAQRRIGQKNSGRAASYGGNQSWFDEYSTLGEQSILQWVSHSKWYDGCYGIPHTDTQGWSPEKIGTGILWDCGQITMYPRYKDKPVAYTEFQYQHTIAHEFGHVLGPDDAYPEANGGIKLKNNDEVPIKPYYAGILMCNNGLSYANDFEMVFEAFAERNYQAILIIRRKKNQR